MMGSTFSEFWAMGGYGVYVWGSMGVSVALLALEVWLARVGRQQALDAACEAMDAGHDDDTARRCTVGTLVPHLPSGVRP